jgi:hypothetical protein
LVDKTTLLNYFNRLKFVASQLTGFLLSKIVPLAQYEGTPTAKSENAKHFVDLATTSVDQLVFACINM